MGEYSSLIGFNTRVGPDNLVAVILCSWCHNIVSRGVRDPLTGYRPVGYQHVVVRIYEGVSELAMDDFDGFMLTQTTGAQNSVKE